MKKVVTSGKKTKLSSIKKKKTRPPVGERTSGAIVYTEDAFRPLTDEELKEWGI